jgi:hypothetical protein
MRETSWRHDVLRYVVGSKQRTAAKCGQQLRLASMWLGAPLSTQRRTLLRRPWQSHFFPLPIVSWSIQAEHSSLIRLNLSHLTMKSLMAIPPMIIKTKRKSVTNSDKVKGKASKPLKKINDWAHWLPMPWYEACWLLNRLAILPIRWQTSSLYMNDVCHLTAHRPMT